VSGPSGAAAPPPTGAEPGIDAQVLQAAAQWRVRLDECPDPDVQRAFKRWLAADPAHERAWQRITATWDAFAAAARPGNRAVLERSFDEERRERRRWRRRGAAAVALLLALLPLAWIAGDLPPAAHLLADHRTATGERWSVRLPDGSLLGLNTATAVNVAFDAGQRRIELLAGEIAVEAAPDPDRPFVVGTAEAEARALGTRFTVQRLPGAGVMVTRVAVQESRVELCASAAREECLRLRADQQASADPDGLSPAATVDAAAAAAWLRGQLVADDRPLTEVLDTLARHHRGLLQIDRAALAGLRVSGVLPLADIDRALAALAASQPIRVRRYTPWVIRIVRRP